MKKVAIFFYVTSSGNDVKLGGAERRLSRLLNQVRKEEFEIDIVLFNPNTIHNSEQSYKKYLGELYVNLIEVKNYRALFKIMFDKRYNIILYTDPYRASIPFIMFSLFINSKRILLNVTTYTSTLKFNSTLQKYLFLFVFMISNKVDVLYPSGYQLLKKKFKRKEISLTPLPTTSTQKFFPNKKKKVILFLGSLEEIKNPLLFLEAVNLIKQHLITYNYKVLICGSGSLKTQLVERIKKHKLSAFVELTGQVESEKILPSTSLFVSIQNYNNYPSQSLLEAISSGCYIIASDEGDTNLLVNGQFGELVSLNESDIAKSIMKYIEFDLKKKNEIVENARNFAVKNFNEKKSIDHITKLLGE